MDHLALQMKVEQVLKELTPNLVQILDADDQILKIHVVSEQFSGLSLASRFELLSELFEKRGLEIVEKFSLVFQAWTKAEQSELEEGGSGTNRESSTRQKRAALPRGL